MREAQEGDARHEGRSPKNWELENIDMMVVAGFTQGSYSTCVFYREEMTLELLHMETILRC